MLVNSTHAIDAQLLTAQKGIDQLKATLKKQENEAKLFLCWSTWTVNRQPHQRGLKAEPNESATRSTDEEENHLLGMDDTNEKDVIGQNTCLGNTGASCHLTNDDEGMFEVTMIASPIKIGSGKLMTVTMTIIQKDGSTHDILK
jgi:hypothetical protein